MSPTSYRVGAELFLGTSGFTGPARQAVGMLENVARQSGLTGTQLRGLAGDFAAAGVGIAGGIKLLREWNEGVQLARELAQDRVLLEVEVARVGMSPGDFGKEMDAYRSRAFEVQSKLSGDMGDMLRMYTQGLQSGIPGSVMRGGLDLAAGYLADMESMEKGPMAAQLYKGSAAFNIAPENLINQVSDPLYRYSHSGLMDFGQMLHELERAGPAIAGMSLPPGASEEQKAKAFENALIALQVIATVRPEGAGRSLTAFQRDLSTPEMRQQQLRYGLDLYDSKGALLPPEEIEARSERVLGGMSPRKRSEALNRMFTDIGGLYIEALAREGSQAGDVRKKGTGHLGLLPSYTDFISQTYGYQAESLSGTASSAKAVAFGPAEQLMKTMAEQFNLQVVTPIGKRILDDEQLQKNISFGGLAAGIGLLGAGGWFGLRGLKNAWGLAGGVARGEALQTVFPDIQKVYVVNATEIGTASGTSAALGNAAGGALAGGGGRALTGVGGAAAGGGMLRGMLGRFAPIGGPAGAIFGGLAVGDLISKIAGPEGWMSSFDEYWASLPDGGDGKLFNTDPLGDEPDIEVGSLPFGWRSGSGQTHGASSRQRRKMGQYVNLAERGAGGTIQTLKGGGTSVNFNMAKAEQKLERTAEALERGARALEQAAINLKAQSGTRTPSSMNARGV